jgi:predicted AAA+ superfamily ATPase
MCFNCMKMGAIMYRIQDVSLDNWYNNKKKNRKPLILRGARQVGKSTLVRNWCKKNKFNLIEINLEKNRKLNTVFATLDMDLIIRELSSVAKQSILKGANTILFLDEIQETPQALPMLRYFYEEYPNLPVVAAGSLLEFLLRNHEFSMPVGRIEYLHMGPMTFAEFLRELKEDFLLEELQQAMLTFKLSQTAHRRALDLFRNFLFIGGMPEAVKIFSSEKNLHDIIPIHAQIIETYRDDFTKYAKTQQLENVEKIFNFLGLHAGEKIKYTNISRESLARDLKKCLDLLFKAKIANPVYNCLGHSLPLEKTIDEKVYKTIHLDIGLMNFMSGVTPESIKNCNERTLIHEGFMAEQFVGQHLLTWDKPFISPRQYYWLREGKSNNAEIDFLKEVSGKILAIEVKSGKSGTLRSLHEWHQLLVTKKVKTESLRYDLNLPSIQKVKSGDISYELQSQPIYMATFPIV